MATYEGIIYDFDAQPEDEFFQLSPDQLVELCAQLAGKPVRVEHAEDGVGRIVAASFDGRRARVKWQMDETAAGWASETLIKHGAAPQLSLKHAAYSNGTVKPIEVSLVQRGARAGSNILGYTANADAEYKTSTDMDIKDQACIGFVVMASAATPVPVAEPAAPAAAPVPAEAAPVAAAPVAAPAAVAAEGAPAPVASDEPAAKKARIEEMQPVEFLNSLSSKVQDSETLQVRLVYV